MPVSFFGLFDEEDRSAMMCPGGTDLLQLFRLGFADRREIRDLLHVRTQRQRPAPVMIYR